MIDTSTLLTILLMASVTYMTRALGYRATAVMEAAPGCVLISVIAPDFVSDKPASLIALAVTLVAATRLSLLPTVLIGVASAGILRHVLG